jgi:hypothetical protein
VDQGDLIVSRQSSVPVGAEDRSDAHHPEAAELGGAKRAHAARAEDERSARHQQQQFLVPGRGTGIEQAVDQAQPRRRPLEQL